MYASDPVALTGRLGAAPPPSDRLRIAELIRSRAGSTRLLDLRATVAAAGGDGQLWAKAEYEHPTGSVKDRAAAWIVAGAWARGQVGEGTILVDASSGNTAVAYARLAREFGFLVELFVPRNANPDRLALLRDLGAEVTLTDPADGTDEAQRAARRFAAQDPGRFYYADQYNNPDNPAAHYSSTGPEIWEQTRGRVTVFIAGVGTGGTITGTGRFLKERSPTLRVVGVQPAGPIHGLEGLKHIPTALRPGVYDESLVDETESVETEEAQEQVRSLARNEHLQVGPSAGAAVVAALRVGCRRRGQVIVTLLPDGAGTGSGGSSR